MLLPPVSDRSRMIASAAESRAADSTSATLGTCPTQRMSGSESMMRATASLRSG
jgi:hypothetical protein